MNALSQSLAQVILIVVCMGLIPVEVYSILVLMAVTTTMMTVPLARRWLPQLANGAHATASQAPSFPLQPDPQTK